jgi:uncharacterized 2Fe-2S/4Fe-4S cluster protein (DUF4445 family)
MPDRKFVTLTFEPSGLKVQAKKGSSVLDVLRSINLEIRSDCGGRSTCGQCKIICKEPDHFGNISKAERKRLPPSELESGCRLACCSRAVLDATVFIPEESLSLHRKFLIGGTEKIVEADPTVRKFYVTVDKPSVSNARSHTSRLIDLLRDTYKLKIDGVSRQIQKTLSETLRKAKGNVTITVSGCHELVSVEAGNTTNELYGIAIDIGTSKIVGYLTDLNTGKLVGAASVENPQLVHGEDVISRLAYVSKGDTELREMQRLAVNGVNAVIQEVCSDSQRDPQHVYEVTVVGNTAMHHLFLGIQPKHLGKSPYTPTIIEPIDTKAGGLSIGVNPNANIHMPPVIAGFVGSDAVADIISTEIYRSNQLSLVIDIGTNTEIILGNRNRMTACSCASGPAFEGSHIECGMKALSGAIEGLHIETSASGDLNIEYETIGKDRPIGICGSGIIDVVANLLKLHIIEKSGVFTTGFHSRRLKTNKGLKKLVLVSRREGAVRDIVVTQKDIEQVQLAKAAIYAGCQILMKTMKIRTRDIRKMYVAGAFGNYMNIDNAKLIGMLPNIRTSSIRFVGNAAGAGARMILISRKHRQVERLVQHKTQYVELALDPDFQEEFSSGMLFTVNSPTFKRDP